LFPALQFQQFIVLKAPGADQMQETKQMLSEYQEPGLKTEGQAVRLKWEMRFCSDWGIMSPSYQGS
jgi:hypothetical protein